MSHMEGLLWWRRANTRVLTRSEYVCDRPKGLYLSGCLLAKHARSSLSEGLVREHHALPVHDARGEHVRALGRKRSGELGVRVGRAREHAQEAAAARAGEGCAVHVWARAREHPADSGRLGVEAEQPLELPVAVEAGTRPRDVGGLVNTINNNNNANNESRKYLPPP
ncbi:hypothetical protein T492DRAFT_186002 [Pavlovales sp. CCMP2436]|nr:hypothetical protein T492DRAFT_186002 [Pavlovales sp. CCMP2436]